jgi:hypothetical protein
MESFVYFLTLRENLEARTVSKMGGEWQGDGARSIRRCISLFLGGRP